MHSKTKYPIVVLKAIQPWLDKSGELFIKEKVRVDELASFKSIDFPEFIFKIKGYVSISESGKVVFNVIYKPHSELGLNFSKIDIKADDIDSYFEHWLSLIRTYKQLRSPEEEVEDKFLRESQEKIYSWFDKEEEDANITQFDPNTILLIDEFLESNIKRLEAGKDDSNVEQIDVLIEEVKEIKAVQSKVSKTKFRMMFSKFLAGVISEAPKVAKEILKDLVKDGVKSLIRGDVNIVGFLN